MKFNLTIALLFLAGCANNTQYAKHDSHAWAELSCSGFETWQNCRTEAQAICPHGFYTANQLENILI